MPSEVKSAFGFAIDFATLGKKHDSAKPLKGFGGGSVLEVVEDDDGNTYRAVYTVKFTSAVYVLDVFQKKSTSGIKTQKRDMDRIKGRLKLAELHHKEKYERKGEGKSQTRRC